MPEKFEELIESYNTGSRNIEDLFEELVKLSRNLSEEQQRHVRENMTEEELVIFDILTRPAPELTTEERAEVKKVARELLNRLKQLLVLTGGRSRRPAPSSSSPSRTCSTRAARAPTRPTLSAKMLGRVRARLRELSRAERGRLCDGGVKACGPY